jgi:hypothetical protein
LHIAALDYASKGFKVFPCVPGAKTPLTEHGFHDASSDPAVIDAWWTEHPDANIAFQPQLMGWSVIDADDYAVEGGDALAGPEIEHGSLPETFTVRTARGGRHLYYAGDLPPSQNKLGPHVDTRGGGSYALLPPSRLPEGEYRVEVSKPVVALPEWPGALIESLRKVKATATIDELDTPRALARAEAYLKSQVAAGKVAVEGDMGDTLTFSTACAVLNLGVSEDRTVDLIDQFWNPHCVPPWGLDELKVKVENAARYSQNEAGSWTAPPPEELLAEALGKLIASAPAEEPLDSMFRLFKPRDLLNRPRPAWLLPDFVQERGSVLLYGPPKSFKTTVVLDAAMHIATGAAGWGREPCEPREVIYVAGEAAENVALQAELWCAARGLNLDDYPLHIFGLMPPIIASPDKAKQMIDLWAAAGVNPDFVVLDTAAKALRGMNENDSRDVGMFADFVDTMRRTLNCAVLAIHHSPKEGGGPRGSIVFTADFDTVHSVERSGPIGEPLVTVQNTDQRLAMEREEPWRFALANDLLAPITGQEFHNRRKQADPLSMQKIFEVLAKFRTPVTTEVLATELVGYFDDDDDKEKAIQACKRKLSARHDLGMFITGQGNDKMWRTPRSAEDGLNRPS